MTHCFIMRLEKAIQFKSDESTGKKLLKVDVYSTIQMILCSEGGGENGDEELSGSVITGDEG